MLSEHGHEFRLILTLFRPDAQAERQTESRETVAAPPGGLIQR